MSTVGHGVAYTATIQHCGSDAFTSFLNHPQNRVWFLDDASTFLPATGSMLVLLGSKARQWQIVGILIEFFNVDPNASSDIDDELHTSVFGMAALSRKWRLCIVLFTTSHA